MQHTPMQLRIRGLRARPVLVPFQRTPMSASGAIPFAALVLIDLETDGGITGRSYVFGFAPWTLEPIAGCLAGLAAMIEGDPLAPLELEAKLRKRLTLLDTPGLAGIALGGIDMAAWDALAIAHGVPLVTLLGGQARPIPAYNSCGLWIQPVETLADEAEQLVADGSFRAVKLRIGRDDPALDLVMPDLQRIGGVTGWLRAAALAHAFGVEMSSHLFPEFSCHLLAVTPTCHWLEYVDWAAPILQEPARLDDGHVIIPALTGSAPGGRNVLILSLLHIVCSSYKQNAGGPSMCDRSRLRCVLALVLFAGCGPSPVGLDAGSADAPTIDAAAVDAWTPDATDGPPEPECNQLLAHVRDFHKTHPDFETFTADGVYPGLVQSTLGTDGTPVYAPAGATPHTSGPVGFSQWYHDTAGVNVNLPVVLTLQETTPGHYSFEAPEFFPIDGRGFGAEGFSHNYHFTTEIHTTFRYRGGEVFTFRGDDDLWLFINDRLAIDLGGLHQPALQTVDLDARASELGLVRDHDYALAIFHAERHTTLSSFRIETTIHCFIPD